MATNRLEILPKSNLQTSKLAWPFPLIPLIKRSVSRNPVRLTHHVTLPSAVVSIIKRNLFRGSFWHREAHIGRNSKQQFPMQRSIIWTGSKNRHERRFRDNGERHTAQQRIRGYCNHEFDSAFRDSWISRINNHPFPRQFRLQLDVLVFL